MVFALRTHFGTRCVYALQIPQKRPRLRFSVDRRESRGNICIIHSNAISGEARLRLIMMQIRDCVYTSHVSSENRHNIMTSLGIYVGLLILTGCGNGATSHSRNPFGDDLDDGDRIEPEEFRPETFEPQSTKAASNNSEEIFFEQGDGADLSKLADFSGMQMKGVNTMKKDKAVHPGSTLDGVTVENAEKVTPDASLEEVTTVEKVASVAEEKRNPSEVQLQIVEELRRGRIPKAEVAALLRKTSANQLLYLKNLNKLNSFGVRAMTVEPDVNIKPSIREIRWTLPTAVTSSKEPDNLQSGSTESIEDSSISSSTDQTTLKFSTPVLEKDFGDSKVGKIYFRNARII